MAKGSGNILLQNIRGRIGKELVIKQYGYGIIIAKYPRIPPKKKPTGLKRIYEVRFKEAVKFARSVKCDPVLKKQYEARLKPGQQLYNYCISIYLKEEKRRSSSSRL